MRAVFACVLAFASSTLAYTVTSPNPSKGWTNAGPQFLAWNRASTDPANFTVVLTNPSPGVVPQGGQILAALVDGSKGNTTMNAAGVGWPVGDGFRLNLVKDAQNLDTILAQSEEFSIKPKVTSNSSSSISSYVVGTTSSVYIAQTTKPLTTMANSSPTSTSTKPSGSSNGALRHSHAYAAVWGVLGTMGFFLA